MRKRLLVIFGIFGLLLAGCHTVPNAAQETKTIAPTGYASKRYNASLYFMMVPCIFIMPPALISRKRKAGSF